MSHTARYGFATRALHAGKDPRERSHTPPIYMTASWEIRTPGELVQGFRGELPLYHRLGGNPTVTYVEKKICSLEGGAAARLRADGMNAVCMSIYAALKRIGRGAQLIAVGPTYGKTYELFRSLGEEGYSVVQLPAKDPNLFRLVAQAMNEKTAAVIGEITTNPTIMLWDVPAVKQSMRERFCVIKGRVPVSVAQERILQEFQMPVLIVDASFTTPYNFRAFEQGGDVVVHSATKGLAAHGAFTLGIVVVSRKTMKEAPDYWPHAQGWANEKGGTPGAMEAWLLGQWMEDLHLRAPVQNRNAEAVAQFLEGHPAVVSVSYPGLASHPQHELAKRIMRTPYNEPAYGSMVAFRIKGGLAAAQRFLFGGTKYTIIKHKPSLGYTKSIDESPALLSQQNMHPADKALFDITDDLIRFSAGTEDTPDLLDAFEHALFISQTVPA